MTRRITLAALVAALLTPAAAQAGTPFTIGEGGAPHLLTESNGTAHVAWSNALTDTITYCQVPRGTTACTNAETLDVPGMEEGAVFLLRESATKLYAVAPIVGSSDIWMATSNNNGVDWTGPVKIYDPSAPTLGTYQGEPVLGPQAGHLTLGSSNPGNYVHAALLNGTESAVGAGASLAGGGVYDHQVVRYGVAGLLAVANNLTSASFWRLTAAEPNSSPSWSPAAIPIAGNLQDTRVASGVSGTYLFGTGGASRDRQEIRKFDEIGLTFGAPITVGTDTGYINDVTVGPSGAVAAIWRRNESSGGNRLQMAISATGAEPYTTVTIAREDVVMAEMDVSLASDNAGWAVYEGTGGGATRQIRLVDTTAVPDPVVAPPPAGGTPAPAPTPAPIVLPKPKPASPTKKTTVSVKGATISLSAPRQCIPSGRPFVATLSWKKQRRKGNLFVKVRRTDFYIGAKRLKIDKKAPFRQTLRIPNPKKGQTYRLRARAFIKVKRGKAPKKSVVTTLKVCA